jgi:hypothetical protein
MGMEISEVYKGRLSQGRNYFHLDSGILRQGFYLLRISGNSGVTIKKFMVTN